jgi:phosphate butyryltransferase
MILNELKRSYTNAEKKTVVIPMAAGDEILSFVGRALQDTARFILIGNKADITSHLESSGADMSLVTIHHCEHESDAALLAASAAAEGRAQVLMKGLLQTSTFIRAVLDKSLKLFPEGNVLSHAAVFQNDGYHKPFILSDAAINISPTAEEKLKILQNAVVFAHRLGIERPKAALIAPVEKVSEKIQSTVDAEKIKTMISEAGVSSPLKRAEVDGPFGLDVALSAKAAQIKGIQSTTAGDADIILLPQLDAGNVCYKSFTLFSRCSTGALVCGAGVPIVLTSRADSEEVKMLSLLLALDTAV